MKINYSREPEPAGTGGALRLARHRLRERFLVLNGDTLFDLNYLDLASLLDGVAAAVALREVPNAGRYGRVLVEGERVATFAEKSGSGPGLINGGVYALTRGVLDLLPEGTSSLERDLLPVLAAAGNLGARSYHGFFIDIGVPEALERAQQLVPAWRRKPAALLDRDGVINVDHGYVHRPEDFEWMPGAIEAIKWLNDNHFLTLVVTNQAGIARGYYTEEDFKRLTGWIGDRLREHGAHLDATYHCPHHPTEGLGGYRVRCNCRKPEPGLIERAAQEWNFSKRDSFLIGDNESDMLAAQRAGVRAVRFPGGDLLEAVRVAVRTSPQFLPASPVTGKG